jgi:glutaredoxin 3
MRQVTVYTTDPCRRCGTVKALLDRHGIVFDEVNLAKDPDGRAELAARTGLTTFPQVVIGATTIGGLDELEAAEASGRLTELVRAA